MKTTVKLCLAVVFLGVCVLLCARSVSKVSGVASDGIAATNGVASVDFDFTRMSSTVKAANLYRLGAVPQEFDGKTLRISGVFLTRVDEKDGKRYFACMMDNPGGCACCAPGGVIEFEPKELYKWPADFPPVESRITVSGLLKMVKIEDDGQIYSVPRLFEADVSH